MYMRLSCLWNPPAVRTWQYERILSNPSHTSRGSVTTAPYSLVLPDHGQRKHRCNGADLPLEETRILTATLIVAL
jgi:hypothetical protein